MQQGCAARWLGCCRARSTDGLPQYVLVAPQCPGGQRTLVYMTQQLRISCWVAQWLARVVVAGSWSITVDSADDLVCKGGAGFSRYGPHTTAALVSVHQRLFVRQSALKSVDCDGRAPQVASRI